MEATLNSVTATAKESAWKDLGDHHNNFRGTHLRQLFEEDQKRGERYTMEASGLLLDYSKNLVTDETLELLFRLAAQSNLQGHIEAMFRGEKINFTENRAVLHTALRAPRDSSVMVGGENVVPKVHAVLDKMAHFSAQVRNGEWRGHTGKQIRNVVNIGIGGSDLGPVMAYEALKYYSDRSIQFRFVSNIDGTDIVEALHDLNPTETLFLVSSKTFTTLETMTNARTARRWLLAGIGGLFLTFFTYTGEAAYASGSAYTLFSIASVVLGGVSLVGGRGSAVGTGLSRGLAHREACPALADRAGKTFGRERGLGL